ncbi:hypothetical protein GIY62_05770 [Burkholderia plantarii]|uniref:hypothetical protein n=1 Tax=Burkholderia plantarii TaxID=41899 RepID=UPI00272B4104|nr:hypothetical protein [Burkholderia plantarii]WLE60167.1 hypothetical protein GIY62_05770 [Burkholderia plantarii]
MPSATEVPIQLDPIPCEGYEIHVTVQPARAIANRYTYVAYLCRPGASAGLPGQTVPFHPNGEESFASVDEAARDAKRVGAMIVDGSHRNLSVQSLVRPGA